MGADVCQVKYLMLRCYRLLETKPLNYIRQVLDKTGIYMATNYDISNLRSPPLCGLTMWQGTSGR
jgi:hypothetical protein